MNASGSFRGLARPRTERMGLIIALMSESVLFLTLLGAYAALRGQIDWQVPHTWERMAVPMTNTALLLTSAIVAWRTGELSKRRDRHSVMVAQLTSLALGVGFLAGQMYEFSHSGMRIDDPTLGGIFFALLGFHGLHVAAGLVLLGIGAMRTRFHEFSTADVAAIQIGTLFWYYVTAVWLLLFIVPYLV
jgi:cytochrome c oxidase subunit 3